MQYISNNPIWNNLVLLFNNYEIGILFVSLHNIIILKPISLGIVFSQYHCIIFAIGRECVLMKSQSKSINGTQWKFNSGVGWNTFLCQVHYEVQAQVLATWSAKENSESLGNCLLTLSCSASGFDGHWVRNYHNYHRHFSAYEDDFQVGRQLIDCQVNANWRKTSNDAACRVDLDKVLGTSRDACTKEAGYGYEDGQPCILLKMNRVGGS